jgi:hypothetical protein
MVAGQAFGMQNASRRPTQTRPAQHVASGAAHDSPSLTHIAALGAPPPSALPGRDGSGVCASGSLGAGTPAETTPGRAGSGLATGTCCAPNGAAASAQAATAQKTALLFNLMSTSPDQPAHCRRYHFAAAERSP